MSRRVRFPLMAKLLLWLMVHLAVLAGAFYLFVAWQLRLGLDSLLSGSAGERLKGVGERVAAELLQAPRPEWPEIIDRHAGDLGLEAGLLVGAGPDPWIGSMEVQVPPNVDQRIKGFRRPEQRPPRGRDGLEAPPGPGGMPRERGRPSPGPPGEPPFPEEAGPAGRDVRPSVQPVFLLRGDGGQGYWAGIDLPLFQPRRGQPLHGLLVLHSPDLSAGGLFFDLKPWILGGLAVLGISLVLWAPFFIGITRYVSRLSQATERIADGKFSVDLGATRLDELGHLGASIESMAARLERLVLGQKRFLGDVAHELCSPLARIQTGLGVLEYGLPDSQKERLASIEEDVGELSRLVSEVLAFTKASTAPAAVKLEAVGLRALIEAAVARECPGQALQWDVASDLAVKADRNLLSRAVANVLRNARRHGGEGCKVEIAAAKQGGMVELRIADDGPGVGPADLPRLFEPFYRPDAARTREAGGSGLGLAIVRSAVESFGGSVVAGSNAPRGLRLVFHLPAADLLDK
jgi:two-component system sensor histidine kinase CpxA